MPASDSLGCGGRPGEPPRRLDEEEWPSLEKTKTLLEIIAALVAILASAVALFDVFSSSSPREPWSVVFGVAPLAVLAVWMGTQLVKRRRFVLLGRAGLALGVYVSVFVVLAASDLFSWRRVLIGYDEAVPANWLGLSRAGDWHYWFAKRKEPRQDLLVVTLAPPVGKTLEEARYRLASLLALARRHRARGVAFDFYFDLQSELDPLLCRQINTSWSQRPPMPVFGGYRHQVVGVLAARLANAPTVERAGCLSDDRLGHLALYRESDGMVRMAPLYLAGNKTLASVDCRVAEALESRDACAAAHTLVQFIEPKNGGALTVPLEAIIADPGRLLRDHFLLVGRDSPHDRFDTPFGRRLGVAIHASVIQALRDQAIVRRVSWWWSAPTIFACCYAVFALSATGAGRGRMIAVTAAMSLAVVTAAALAMHTALVWLDISYPLIAIWLLLLLLLAIRFKIRSGPVGPVAPVGPVGPVGPEVSAGPIAPSRPAKTEPPERGAETKMTSHRQGHLLKELRKHAAHFTQEG